MPTLTLRRQASNIATRLLSLMASTAVVVDRHIFGIQDMLSGDGIFRVRRTVEVIVARIRDLEEGMQAFKARAEAYSGTSIAAKAID